MKSFNNFKISTKLISSFLFIALCASIVGAVGIIQINKLHASDTEMYEKMTVPMSTTAEMAKLFQQIRVNTREMILEDNVTQIDARYDYVDELIVKLDALSEEFEETILSDEMQDAFDNYIVTRSGFRSSLDELYILSMQNKDDEAFDLIKGTMQASADAEQDAIDLLVSMKVEDAYEKSLDNELIANNATVMMIFIVSFGFILSIVLGIVISQFIITKPLKKILVCANSIADGDLNTSIDINSKDEIGELAKAFTIMANSINNVLNNIDYASEQVSSGANQVSNSSISLSKGSTEQASSVEQLTVSINDIALQTKQNAENANKAKKITKQTEVNASNGNKQMEDMLLAMSEINQSSNNISKIIKVIDDIAFQTNILALNAAVEAARAGQHGKGFSVVAEEVRNLAGRSAEAAKETTSMIEKSINKVEDGAKIAKDTAKALDKIVKGITEASELISNIAIASDKQALEVNQVNEGINQIAKIVQTTSATSEETASASEELSNQAELLKEQVNKFKLKNTSQLYSQKEQDDLNPKVLEMLDNMNSSKMSYSNLYKEEKEKSDITVCEKIDLSDSEFGKY